VQVSDRLKDAAQVQKILGEYGCCIKTRPDSAKNVFTVLNFSDRILFKGMIAKWMEKN